MSRRRNVEYDDDYYDDGYYDEEEEEEEEEEDAASASQYLRRAGDDAHAATDPSQAELLNSLAEAFRVCLDDARIPRDQIDAALVAADYDVDAAIQVMRQQLAADEAQTAQAAARLVASEPSAIARMVDVDANDTQVPAVPTEAFPAPPSPGATAAFAFDQPSPDDLVQRRQQAGRARTKAAGSSALSRPPAPARKTRGNVTDVAAPPSKQLPAAPPAPARPLEAKRLSQQAPASASSAAAPKQRARKLKLQSPEDLVLRAPSVAIVVAGHVDAGKVRLLSSPDSDPFFNRAVSADAFRPLHSDVSVAQSTLVGHLLRLVGAVPAASSRRSSGAAAAGRRPSGNHAASEPSLAWTTDEDRVEQERGVTIDIATRIFQGRTSGTTFSLIDAPGHRDYVPAMILGACQASAAMLVVDASTGEFESGFSEQGQTREHAVLLRSLGIRRLIVVVNKMDMAQFAESRFLEVQAVLTPYLKTLGWKAGKDVAFVPAAGLSGVNLVEGPPGDRHPLSAWYKGGTVLGALEALPPAVAQEIAQAMRRPTRLVVSDSFRSATLGGVTAISGRIVSGTVATKDQLLLSPTTEVATVKALEVGCTARRGDDGYAVAAADNLPVSLGLTDISDAVIISPGDVLCDPQSPVPVVSRFRAQVVIMASPVPLVRGVQVELHLGGMCEAATISKLVERRPGGPADAGERAKKPPRMLVKGDAATVEVTVVRPVCVERAADVKFLGRFALRCHGKTVAAGMVTDLLKAKRPAPWAVAPEGSAPPTANRSAT
jgi:elongation factor 1 alpha-like protein